MKQMIKKYIIGGAVPSIAFLLLSVSVGFSADTKPPANVANATTANNNKNNSIDTLFLSPDIHPLTAKELRSLNLSRKWAKGGIKPYMSCGKLVYVYGQSGIPTVIASPMQVSDVELQPGEQINEIVVGDSARWAVAEGIAGNTRHLFIKPVDSGLESSAVITTDRRVYHLRLLSRRNSHIPYIGFAYPDDFRILLARKNAQEAKDKEWRTTVNAQGQPVDLTALNFEYIVRGDAKWKPVRVFDDGRKTYIQLPKSVKSNVMPALLVKKGKTDVLVNYRVKGLVMEVDGLFDTVALVVGVGSQQQSVEVSRKGVRRPTKMKIKRGDD